MKKTFLAALRVLAICALMMPVVSCEKEFGSENEPGNEPGKEDVKDDSWINTTDVAVTGVVEVCGVSFAVINGYVNLDLLPLGSIDSGDVDLDSANISFGIELVRDTASIDKKSIWENTSMQKDTISFSEKRTVPLKYKFSVERKGLSDARKYVYRTFVTHNDTVTYYGESQTFTTGSFCSRSHVHAVDLGLSVKWACCNVDATAPEEFGGYYAWGEIEEKSYYDESTYLYWQNDSVDLGDDICGSRYDVAYIKWGEDWRMPTREEIKELHEKCSWHWSAVNGVMGYEVTGPNGNAIFLPAAGYRYRDGIYGNGSYGTYRSSSVYEDYGYYAYYLLFYEKNGELYREWDYNHCCRGFSVRPVNVKK